MNNFLKEFVVVNEKHLKARWGGRPKGELFRCFFCGYKFQLGDEFRAVFTNDSGKDTIGGNPLICHPCFDKHGGYEESRKEWKRMHDVLPWWAGEIF